MSSFPLSTTWREQCIAVFEILNTSPERPISPPEGCPSVWSKSIATLNVLLPLLSLRCLSFEIELLLVLEFFCLLVFLQNSFVAYLWFLFYVDVCVLTHSVVSNVTEIKV